LAGQDGGGIQSGAAPTGCLRLPECLPKRIPVVPMVRLAAAQSVRGKGIGGILLVDALQRTMRVAAEIGIAAVVVDPKDETAVRFCEHFGFSRFRDAPNRPVLPLRTALDLFG